MAKQLIINDDQIGPFIELLIGGPDGQTFYRYTKVGQKFELADFGTATVVDVDMDYDYDRTSTDNYIVFKVEFADGSVKHYRKTGTADSYGGREWDSGFPEVVAKQVMRTEFVNA